MTKRLVFALLFTLALAAAPPDPVSWKITNGPVTPLKPGSRFNLTLTATVTPGWHFYSMKPVAQGPTPARIWIADGQPFLQAGVIKATTPRTEQDPSFNMELEIYEGEASFDMPVRIPLSIATGSQMLVVNASYQACNDKICLPPKTVKVTQAVDITR